MWWYEESCFHRFIEFYSVVHVLSVVGLSPCGPAKGPPKNLAAKKMADADDLLDADDQIELEDEYDANYEPTENGTAHLQSASPSSDALQICGNTPRSLGWTWTKSHS